MVLNMKKEKINKDNLIFYIAISIWFFLSLSGTSNIINISQETTRFIQLLSIFLLLAKIIEEKIPKKNLLFILSIGLISVYEFIKIGNAMFLMNFLIIFSLKKIKIEKIIKIDILIKSGYLALHILTYLFYILFNNELLSTTVFHSASVGYRNSLFFTHPNAAGSIAIFLAIDLIFICKNKLKMIILVSGMVIFILNLTKSRTSILIYILFLIIYFILKNDKCKKLIYNINIIELPLFTLTNIILCFMPDIMKNSFFAKLDVILSGRIRYSTIAVKKYGIHLLPYKINDGLLDRTIKIDDFFIRSGIEYGIIILILFNIIYIKCIKKKEISALERALLIILPIFLLSELFPFNIGRTICMLVLGDILINEKTSEK